MDKRNRSRSRSVEKKVESKDKIRQQYLGIQSENKKEKKHIINRERQRNILKFEWDEREDTYESSYLPTYLPSKTNHSQNKNKTHQQDPYLKRTWTEKKLEQMTDRDWLIFREDNQI